MQDASGPKFSWSLARALRASHDHSHGQGDTVQVSKPVLMGHWQLLAQSCWPVYETGLLQVWE